MSQLGLPFEMGQTLYGGAPTNTPGNSELGQVISITDTRNLTLRPLRLCKVLNATGSTITSPGGKPVRWAAGAYGTQIGALATNVLDCDFAGWIDEARTASIAANDVFWICLDGPHNRNGHTSDLIASPAAIARNRLALVRVEEDFQNGATLPLSLVEIGTTPTHTVVDGFGGIMNFAHAVNTDNAVGGFGGQNESFLFSANRPIHFAARVRTNFDGGTSSNFAFGFTNAVAAATLPITDAGALAASFSGCLIYKLEADAVWRAVQSVATTQSIDTDCGAVATATWYDLAIDWVPGATTGIAYFYINGTLVHTSSAIAFASATEMEVVAKCKSGHATEDCSFDIDYFCVYQTRSATS